MFKNLSPGAIGIRNLALAEAIELAQKSGFEGIDFNIREAAALADEHGVDYVRQLFEQAGVRPGLWGFPVTWNKEEAQWKQDLAELPRLAVLGRDLGCLRTATWVPPNSVERPFKENFEWHVARFKPAAEVLKDYGCRLGLEFIGPQTYGRRINMPSSTPWKACWNWPRRLGRVMSACCSTPGISTPRVGASPIWTRSRPTMW